MSTPKKNGGFSLIEVLGATALVAILMTVALVSVVPILAEGKANTTQAFVDKAADQVQAYYMANDSYPADLSALEDAGYIERIPNDPYGNAYVYATPAVYTTSIGFDLYSSGPDGTAQTSDDIGAGNYDHSVTP